MEQRRVTLANAVENVDTLEQLLLHHDQPCIEALSLAIHFRANFDTNFEDRDAFVSCVAKFMEQATIQADLNTLLEEGKQHAIMLYTWRSCSRAVPQTDNEGTRQEIYQTVVEILDPYVQKLIDFMNFQDRAIALFCNEVKKLCHKEKKADFVSEAYLLTLGKLINMFAELDELKNMKASVRNDYSAHRRARQFLKSSDDNITEESLKLSMNLATQNVMSDNLKSQVQNIKGYEELLADVVNISVTMFERKMYLTQTEKHMLVKVMALTLFLMDTPTGPNIYQMNEKKRINLSKIDHIIKQNEVVPLYGDMMIAPYNFIKKSPNFDPTKWSCCESLKSSSQSDLISSLPAIRQRHLEYISTLPLQNKLIARDSQENPRTKEENAELSLSALRGLQLVSEWTQAVMELYSWKLMNPTRPEINKECPHTAEGYERATRYNFNGREKFALIEVIAMIKGLQVILSRMEPIFMDAIHSHIYSELQEFVQRSLRDPIRRATRKKKDILRIVLLSVRDTCVDWLRGFPPPNDPATTGMKDPVEGFHFKVPQRNVGPSSTQLYLVRTMLESLTKECGGIKKSRRKEMDEQHVAIIEEFHEKSFFWHYLLNFNESLFNCCDLSQLWFREFFLELTMGKRIQFPIEMSLPWILTDHILETKEASMMEFILYPLDLYNDSAQYALMTFKKQFFYDEIEAEVNLCFDQFVYKLSDQIFAYYKHLAGCIMLDKKFRSQVIAHGQNIKFPVSNQYETLLKQRNVQLLGRSIDLNRLMSPLINTALQKALDIAISRFEAGDITGIIKLEGLIEVNRLAHKLMRKYLPLNDFDAMLKEADRNVTSPHGRITLHVFWEINTELLPGYCYNASTNRFVKTAFSLTKEAKREKVPNISAYYIWGTKLLNNCFSTIYSLYSGFFGPPHFQAICRLLGYLGIAVVIDELLKTVENIIAGEAAQYVTTLMTVIPDRMTLPFFGYGSAGVLGYYEARMADFIQYSDLRTEVFHRFTEIGNAVIFCFLLEQAVNQEEVLDLKQAALFQNVVPKPSIPINEQQSNSRELAQRTMELLLEKYSHLHVSKVVLKNGTAQQVSIAEESELLTGERLCSGLSIFEIVLKRIASLVNKPLWRGTPPSNEEMTVERCNEFHRLWSAIQFVYCIPTKDTEFTVEEMFGEGLNWAGCTIIAVLQQQRRFELLDFCYHLQTVFKVDSKDDKMGGVQVKKMVDRIRKFQVLNNEIFSILNKYLKTGEDQSTAANVVLFSPPTSGPNSTNL